MSVDPKLVAIRAAAAAIGQFRDELDRMELMWRLARVLELPKDFRPCCAHDEAPCIHQGKPCECWACRKLTAQGLAAAVNRDPPPRKVCQAGGCAQTAKHGPDGEAVACWSHAGDWPEVAP